MLATQTQTSLVLGGVNDIEEFAKRIKTMMRGGDKLSNNDAIALAQFAKVTGLNPFIGECWWIPGSGAMVGIAGARRKDQERSADRGGYSFPNITVCTPEEAGAAEAEVKDVVAAFKCEINDSAATMEYQKMFSATIQSMRDAGISDPFSAAKEVCGPRPTWIGYGFAKKTEQTRMSKVQAARKRAEADALKKRIVIPFGGQMAESDVAPDYVDAQAEDEPKEPKRTREQSLKELGVEEVQSGEAPAVVLIDPHGDEAVRIADAVWNIGTKAAAQDLWKLFPKGTKYMTAEEIKAAVTQAPKTEAV